MADSSRLPGADSEETLARVPDVLRAWVRFAADRRGVSDRSRDEAVAAVAEWEDELRSAADPEQWGMARRSWRGA